MCKRQKLKEDYINTTMKKKILKVLLLHFIIIAVITAFVFFIPCPLYSIFKVHCPLCGMTRAIVTFFQGNFAIAFKLHPLFLLFPFAVLFFSHARLINNKTGKPYITIIIGIIIILAFIIAYFVRDKSILDSYPQPFLR